MSNSDGSTEEGTSLSTPASSVRANATKHARHFDVDAMFAAAVHSATLSSAETTMARGGRGEVEIEEDGRGKAGSEKHPSGKSIDHAAKQWKEAQEGIRKIRLPNAERDHTDDGDEIGPPMPPPLAGTSSAPGDDEDDDLVGPPMPPGFVGDPSTQVSEEEKKRILDSGVEEDFDDDDEFEDYGDGEVPIIQLIPTACEAIIKHGKKAVSAAAFDQQGLRFVTGGYDYVVNLFEFQKMDVSLKPTRELRPVESHVINSLSFNANGEYILVGSGNAQIRLLDRRGKQWSDTVRGDQYLVDLTNTKGHTAAVNCCCWNPLIKNEFLSAGDDGTLRIWNIDDYKQITHCLNKQRHLIKTKNANGKRAIPTSCAYSRDGKMIAAGCDDGSLQIWKYGSLYVNTKHLNRSAHKGPITCVAFSPDGKRILTRGLDDSLKMFELSKFKEPVLVNDTLENHFPTTDCGFSPRGEMVFTGTSVRNDEGAMGRFVFLDANTFELVYQIQYPGVSCVRIHWHAKINQILVGLSDGTCRLYYDPATSHRGALECVTRPLRRQRKSEVMKEAMVLAPLTLEMFQARGEDSEEKEVTGWRLKKYLRMQDNKLRPEFRKPAAMPMSGPSTGGRVAQHGGTLHSYIAQQAGVKRNREFLEDDDVRASILRHAEEAEKNPYYVAPAYLKNQPKPIFQAKTTAPEDDEEVDEDSHPFKMPRMAQ